VARKPTLRDVSRVSGLSTYTVSRALSNGEGVSAASRELVLKTARELGYVPNRAAQELRKKTRSSIAVITASTSNYYYIDLMNGVQRTLQPTGRTAIVADIAAGGAYTPEQEDATVQALVEARTAGVISTLTLHPQNTKLLQDWDIPVVFVDSMPPEMEIEVPSITMDNYAGSTKVAEHLVEHGYDDWLFLAYPARWSTRYERERGLREAAQRFGVDLTVVESENDPESAYTALTEHLDGPNAAAPRVVIASNNTTLHGALSVLQDRHLAIPDDVAVVAYDEFAWAPLLDPPLTVLDEDSDRIGVLAAQILTRIIDEQAAAERAGSATTPVYQPGDRKVVNADLIVRRSCGC
jgi:LacI family transcriptional regulator